jgi:hypothetical protein
MSASRHEEPTPDETSTGPSDAHRDAVRTASEEAALVTERERAERRATQGDDWQMRLRGGALETRRRLRPAGRGLRAFLGRIAPPISRGLLAIVRLPVALVLRLLEAAQGAIGWARPRLAALASGFGALVVKHVTPVNTVAFVCLVAAVSLGVSQFMDYRGVAVGADLYEGEVGTVAPPPLRDVETAGSAHLYLLLPVAIAAIALTFLIARGRQELWRILCGLGVLVVLVSLAVDLPRADLGQTTPFASSDVELLDGFWIQLFTGAVIALCGYLFGRYSKEEQPRPASPPTLSSPETVSFRVERPDRDPLAPPEDSPAPGRSGPLPPWEAGA